ncbi:MAG TPA: acyl-CoA dehydrogenase family protein [Gammaproteobacteria bacterium]|nr:acyl-CoA dehydrogenase family protein [Gammaproteobacteria bacterium]
MITQPHFHSKTHEVFNGVPGVPNANWYDLDIPLQEALKREGGKWGEGQVKSYGNLVGRTIYQLGFLANENPPTFFSHDMTGHRIDEVRYIPAYHEILNIAISNNLHGLPWHKSKKGAHVVRGALNYLHYQAEAGTACPITMTFAAVPLIRKVDSIAKKWLPKILSTQYDPKNAPIEEKVGAMIGMALTEKQGGSDVKANTTRAHPVGQAGMGQEYEIIGHKWFCSAPLSDAFLVTAKAPEGLSCFLVPRWRPDGTHNAFYIQQLKNKCGDKSNALAEVELWGAYGQMLGEPGKGLTTILEMIMLTRFDCIVASSALMRQALFQALHFVKHRSCFGKKLIMQPLMQNVLCDLALEVEGALALSFRLARALDYCQDEHAASLLRIGTAIGKYWCCKRATLIVNEAQECLGGLGYIEASIMPRLYRQAPLNSIWEGCGNIQCLDVLRALKNQPQTLEIFWQEILKTRGQNKDFDIALAKLQKRMPEISWDPFLGRQLVSEMALLWQSALLLEYAPSEVSNAFCQSRLSETRGYSFGSLPKGTAVNTILERALKGALGNAIY